MSIVIVHNAEINRPEPEALTSSVLDHATVKTFTGGQNDSFGPRNNSGLWPSYNCIDTLVPTPICRDPFSERKIFTKAGQWVPGFEFAVYGAVECAVIGLDRDDMARELSRVFERSEGRGIEQALLLNRFVAKEPESGDRPNEAYWDAPVDITPASAVNLKIAIGLLEGHAAATYAGVPTLHLPRAAVAILGSDVLVWEGDKIFTRAGSKVAVGGGYDSTEVPVSGEWDLFATGEIYVERSETITHSMLVIPGESADAGSDEETFEDNTAIALSERMFRVGIDCYAAKITATVWS